MGKAKLEIKNGRFTGYAMVPVEDLSLHGLIKYFDLSEYTPVQISEYTGHSIRAVHNAIDSCKQSGVKPNVIMRHGNGGVGRRGGKYRKVALQDTDTVTQARLKKLMIANGDRCSDLARYVGVTNTTAMYWVHNGVVPQMPTMIKIAKHYHVQVAYLTGESRVPMAPMR